MSEHTSTNTDTAALRTDVDMEDLSDITKALPTEAPLNAPVDAHEDANSMGDTTQTTPNQATPPKDKDKDEEEAAMERLSQLIAKFTKQKVELRDYAPPAECKQYIAQRKDILYAYLDHTTFTVKIWTNFDAAEEVFYDGARAVDCGKLQIPKEKLKHFLSLDGEEANFRKIQLEVGTPFRTLANFWLSLRHLDGEDSLNIRGKMVEQHRPRELAPLRDFLASVVRRIDNAGIDRNLTMEDLVGIAALFRRDPNRGQEDDWEQPAYGGGEWVGIEEPPSVIRNNWR